MFKIRQIDFTVSYILFFVMILSFALILKKWKNLSFVHLHFGDLFDTFFEDSDHVFTSCNFWQRVFLNGLFLKFELIFEPVDFGPLFVSYFLDT